MNRTTATKSRLSSTKSQALCVPTSLANVLTFLADDNNITSFTRELPSGKKEDVQVSKLNTYIAKNLKIDKDGFVHHDRAIKFINQFADLNAQINYVNHPYHYKLKLPKYALLILKIGYPKDAKALVGQTYNQCVLSNGLGNATASVKGVMSNSDNKITHAVCLANNKLIDPTSGMHGVVLDMKKLDPQEAHERHAANDEAKDSLATCMGTPSEDLGGRYDEIGIDHVIEIGFASNLPKTVESQRADWKSDDFIKDTYGDNPTTTRKSHLQCKQVATWKCTGACGMRLPRDEFAKRQGSKSNHKRKCIVCNQKEEQEKQKKRKRIDPQGEEQNKRKKI